MIGRFDVLRKKLNESEKALHLIISLSVAIHVADMAALSLAFFSGSYLDQYSQMTPVVVYMSEMSIQHTLSLFIKVSFSS